MNSKMTSEKKMTLKEVAEATGAGYSTIAEYAKKAGWTRNGKKTLLNETQVTAILEAMKQATNNQSNLPGRLEGVKTDMSIDLQIALAERNAKELWKRKALEQEGRAIKAEQKLNRVEAAFGREVLAHQETRTGLETYQRIAESRGLAMSDRDDLVSLYRKG